MRMAESLSLNMNDFVYTRHQGILAFGELQHAMWLYSNNAARGCASTFDSNVNFGSIDPTPQMKHEM